MFKTEVNKEQTIQQRAEDQVEIVYYTDPLCCWSWAFEPQWRRLRYEYSGKIRFRYRMGGMLPDWQRFTDPLNSVERPIQMGPLWLEAKYKSGMPIEDKVWHFDPPESSHPACMAVKCAELQSGKAEELYLRKVREAIMLEGRNIAREEILLDAAENVNKEDPGTLDIERFRRDLKSGAGAGAFREDMKEARYHQIGRFPTLTLKGANPKGVVITGYRPYAVLLEALQQVAPEITPTHPDPDPDHYLTFWGSMTDRELQEVQPISAG